MVKAAELDKKLWIKIVDEHKQGTIYQPLRSGRIRHKVNF